ncbi:hypothetical protein EVAR_42760_1 [Eumeta japonica]|uniref:Uncharacterized protein n=1 Tax=Eumeta variegata TaxID=151549 RepID=A0A4C1WMP7_EUMVA|nr:hypothetical protein EVAR_42760_1 [Eumeta japonica]
MFVVNRNAALNDLREIGGEDTACQTPRPAASRRPRAPCRRPIRRNSNLDPDPGPGLELDYGVAFNPGSDLNFDLIRIKLALRNSTGVKSEARTDIERRNNIGILAGSIIGRYKRLYAIGLAEIVSRTGSCRKSVQLHKSESKFCLRSEPCALAGACDVTSPPRWRHPPFAPA